MSCCSKPIGSGPSSTAVRNKTWASAPMLRGPAYYN
jgi:hypothetical protein